MKDNWWRGALSTHTIKYQQGAQKKALSTFWNLQIIEVLHHLYVKIILDHLQFGSKPTSQQFQT